MEPSTCVPAQLPHQRRQQRRQKQRQKQERKRDGQPSFNLQPHNTKEKNSKHLQRARARAKLTTHPVTYGSKITDRKERSEQP